MPRALDDAWFPAACVLAGYFAVAQGLGNLYPFSTFEMYAGVEAHSASRLLARDGDGRVHEIREFSAYRCGPIDLRPAGCAGGEDYYTIGYVEREAAEDLAARTAAPMSGPARDVLLIRRVWRFHGPDAPSVDDCAVATCQAVAR